MNELRWATRCPPRGAGQEDTARAKRSRGRCSWSGAASLVEKGSLCNALRLLPLVPIALTVVTLSAQAPAAKWWAHVSFLADDSMKGRDTGSPEHRKAAEYIAREFEKAGLTPGGTKGFFQAVPFRSRKINEAQSSLALVHKDGRVVPVVLGDEATFSMRIEPAPKVEAPIVFAGYALQVPEVKHDDLKGLDVKGKIVLHMTGGPSTIPGPLLAHYQATRWEYLKRAGAIGTFSIQNPKGQDIPWDRSKLSRFMPSLAIADPALDETLGQQVAVTINSAMADKFLEGSGHTIKELLALSNDGKVLPHFAIPASARIQVADRREGDRIRQRHRHPARHRSRAPRSIRHRFRASGSRRRRRSRSRATASTTAPWTTRRGSPR